MKGGVYRMLTNNHRIPLQGIPPCDKSHPYPVRHGHACITPKIQKT